MTVLESTLQNSPSNSFPGCFPTHSVFQPCQGYTFVPSMQVRKLRLNAQVDLSRSSQFLSKLPTTTPPPPPRYAPTSLGCLVHTQATSHRFLQPGVLHSVRQPCCPRTKLRPWRHILNSSDIPRKQPSHLTIYVCVCVYVCVFACVCVCVYAAVYTVCPLYSRVPHPEVQ